MMNLIGVQTLAKRETNRFLKVYMQTLLSPLVTTVLFFSIFALGGMRGDIADAPQILGTSFMQFLAPGLIVMSMAQNAFANTSSSVQIGKAQGNLTDILMAPLGPWELMVGYLSGAVARGICVGLVSGIGLSFFIDIQITHLWAIAYFGVMGCVMMAAFGLMAGLWADKFDHMAAITNFIVTPLTFLSGTFYTLDRLPEWIQIPASYNPFFFMIDGFRYGFIGQSDHSIMAALIGFTIVTAIVVGAAYSLIRAGYKIKS